MITFTEIRFARAQWETVLDHFLKERGWKRSNRGVLQKLIFGKTIDVSDAEEAYTIECVLEFQKLSDSNTAT